MAYRDGIVVAAYLWGRRYILPVARQTQVVLRLHVQMATLLASAHAQTVLLIWHQDRPRSLLVER